MEKRTRRKFTSAFKAKVVIEALKERSSIEEIARKHELHPNQITQWKKAFLDKAATVFEDTETRSEDLKHQDEEKQKLYSQIGELTVQNNWLKKKLDL